MTYYTDLLKVSHTGAAIIWLVRCLLLKKHGRVSGVQGVCQLRDPQILVSSLYHNSLIKWVFALACDPP